MYLKGEWSHLEDTNKSFGDPVYISTGNDYYDDTFSPEFLLIADKKVGITGLSNPVRPILCFKVRS